MEKEKSLLERVSQGVIDGDDDLVKEAVEKAISEGISPLTIIDKGLIKGIEIVGDNFEKGEFFLPDMICGANAMEVGVQILKPMLKEGSEKKEARGVIVFGTVKGDLHDIGKNIVIMMLKANGYEVHDLGIDVHPDKFIDKVKETNADILGLSALLTTTISAQKEVIQRLEKEGLKEAVKVIVGGAPLTAEWAIKIGAEGYAHDAIGAVKEANRIMSS